MRRHLGSAGLSYGQVFVLILGFMIASSLIFSFGFLVGQRRTEWLLAREERVIRRDMPQQPTPSGAEGPRDVDIAFYENMKEKAYRRLQEGTVGGGPVATAAPQSRQTMQSTLPAAASTPTAPRVAAKPTAAAAAQPGSGGSEWADAGWTVQVNATTNPQQATDLARNLKAKGYDAYTVQAPLRGQTWYRVRVGRFASREKAREMETQLKAKEGMENAYVTPQ
jgi:cell division septation protein DedD